MRRQLVRPDPLASLTPAHVAALVAARGELVLVGLHYRVPCSLGAAKHAIGVICDLERRGFLRRLNPETVERSNVGRSAARVLAHRAAVRVKLLKGDA